MAKHTTKAEIKHLREALQQVWYVLNGSEKYFDKRNLIHFVETILGPSALFKEAVCPGCKGTRKISA